MHRELIGLYSIGDLKRAASEGKACYSCERFEDFYRRLILSIGAALEGRSLGRLTRTGRQEVFESKVALEDSVGLRLALKKMIRTRPAAKETPKDSVSLDRIRKVARICPEAEKLIEDLSPNPAALNHGTRVASYTRHVAEMLNHVRE
ncbi:MAG TPA: hypothetical protein DIU35_19180 [Candidatus Latescibacteria bacterium]|nr:hypothetical protein [Gemmatimonadota bacterium]HCR19604.1 hypothetical protein [Candidatus Latescibacterota bacterium]|tara:strand:+ start:386 stop:829 length:444 start_codon:yes stop_codon:yes gene_type:complete